MKNSKIVVLGYGAVGQATVKLLHEKGMQVTVAQRTAPKDLPEGVSFKHCDILSSESVDSCLQGFDQLVIAIGFEYKTQVWQKQWPIAMQNIIAASVKQGLRAVFVDNLYMYGPQENALHEEMQLSTHPGKPAVRATITRMWQEAVMTHGLKFTALRAPDFFGPKVLLSQLGEVVFGNLAKGGKAQFLVPLHQPHDFAYVPDIARAVDELLNAPNEDFGQVWHMPCAPTTNLQQLTEWGAQSLGVEPKVMVVPLWLLRLLGIFWPLAKEIWDMRFQWDRPYYVNADKFKQRFAFTPTPFSKSIPATARSFDVADSG
jgi:nucleoside-diphosphate-sugar epimerase